MSHPDIVPLFPELNSDNDCLDLSDMTSGNIYAIKDRSLCLAIQYLSSIEHKLPDSIALIHIARCIENYFCDADLIDKV